VTHNSLIALSVSTGNCIAVHRIPEIGCLFADNVVEKPIHKFAGQLPHTSPHNYKTCTFVSFCFRCHLPLVASKHLDCLSVTIRIFLITVTLNILSYSKLYLFLQTITVISRVTFSFAVVVTVSFL